MKNKKLKSFVFPGFVFSIFLLSVPYSAASDSPSYLFNTYLQSRYVTESDVNASSGKLQVNESDFNFTFEDKISGQLPLTLSFAYRHVDIDESVAVELPAHLEGRRLGVGTKFPVPFVDAENYYLGIDVFPSMYTDDWKWENSAFRMPFRTYLIYKESDDFILVAGVSVRIDYDETILPVIGFKYVASDQLTFNFISDHPHVAYKIDDRLTALWEVDFIRDEYEVTRGSDKNVILKYRSFSTGAGLKYAIDDQMEISGTVGGVFGRRVEYEDDRGKVEPDAGLYTQIKVAFKF